MTIEEKLKEFILSRYKSLREFTQTIGIPYSTMDSILKRGIGNSSVSNIIKVCNALHISADALANGEIQSKFDNVPAATADIRDIVNDTKFRLSQIEHLTIDGRDIDIEYTEPIVNALDIGYEMVKKKSNRIHNKT